MPVLRDSTIASASLGNSVTSSWFGKKEALPFHATRLSYSQIASSTRGTARLQIFPISDHLCRTCRHVEVLLSSTPPPSSTRLLAANRSRPVLVEGALLQQPRLSFANHLLFAVLGHE